MLYLKFEKINNLCHQKLAVYLGIHTQVKNLSGFGVVNMKFPLVFFLVFLLFSFFFFNAKIFGMSFADIEKTLRTLTIGVA